MATLGELMTRDVLTAAPEDTLGEVASNIVARGVGSVVVSDFGRVVVILTERDMLRAMADRTHPSHASVREWMTADPVTASESTSPAEAARTMLENNFRHLPAVERGRAVGVVSIRDIVEWVSAERQGR